MIVHTTPASKRAQTKQEQRPKLVVSRSRRRVSRQFDHFERHAEEAADQIARGELSVAKMLTRRSAASYPAPTSRGEPLPMGIRESFEDAFGADLSAVRVHHDEVAAAAARKERAIAFTAGRDVFFAAGEYRPESADGARLLAHELAHVLQQTAEAGPGGALKATAATGSGPIQRVEDEAPFPSSPASPSLADILNGHIAASANPDALADLLTLQAAALQAPDPNGFFALRASFVKSQAKDPLWGKAPDDLHLETLSALYDCLKRTGNLAGAALLLHRKPDVKTLFLSAEVYVEHIKQFTFATTLDALYDIWNTDPFFEGARPRHFIDRMVIYLLGPTRERSKQTVKGGIDLDQEIKDQAAEIDNPTGPMKNELFVAAMIGVGEFEVLRYATVEAEEKELPANLNMAQRKLRLTYGLMAFAEQIHKNWKTKLLPQTNAERHFSKETLFFYARDYAPALINICKLAEKFWQTAAAFQDLDKQIYGMGVTPGELLRSIKEDSFFEPFEPAVTAVADEMFFRQPDGKLPDPADYDKRKKAARKNFIAVVHKDFERPFADLFKQAAPENKGPRELSFPKDATNLVDMKRFARLGWVLTQASAIIRVLDKYDKSADVAFVKRAQAIDKNYPANDYREANRIRLARIIAGTAGLVNWGDLARRCQSILRAQESTESWRQKQDVVAFVGEWQIDAEAPIEKLLTESGPGEILEGWEPFTIWEIVHFYVAEGYRDFTSKINTLVGAEKGTYDKKAAPLLNKAYEQTKLVRPVRYRIPREEWESAVGFDDAGTDPNAPAGTTPAVAPRKTIQAHVRDHPKTTELVDKHQAKYGYEPLGIVPSKQTPEAVIWMVPHPIALVQKLQADPVINQTLEAVLKAGVVVKEKNAKGEETSRTVKGLSVADLKALPWQEWWLIFTSGALPLRVARGLMADMKLTDLLQREQEAAWKELQNARREAFNHERRRLVEHQWKPILKAYKRTAKAYDLITVDKSQVPVRSLPMEMLRFIFRFLSQVVERSETKLEKEETPERDAHFALAFIELSELLEEKFHEPKGTFEIDIKNEIVFHFVPVLYVVLDRIDKGGLEPFLVLEERDKPDLITKGKERLERILAYMEDLATRNQKDYGIIAVAGDGTIEDPGHIRPVDWDIKIDETTPFRIDGRTWHIVEVVQSFTYHPGAWLRRGEKTRRKNIGSLLKIGDGEYKKEDERGQGVLMRISQEEGGTTFDVHEGGEEAENILTQLTWDATMHARVEHMKALAEAIETIAQYGLDIAELFPGVGPAVAATRLLTGVLGFLTSEGPELVKGLLKDPEKLLDTVKEKMMEALSPEKILYFLLFDFQGFDLALKKPDTKVGGRIKSSSSGLLRKVLRRVRSIGLGLLNALGRLGLNVRGKRESAQMFVMNRPILVRVVGVVADYFRFIAQLPAMAEELVEFKEHAGEFQKRLGEMIDSMGDIELPGALITVDDIVNVALDVIGHRLGGKYKLGVKILFELLELIGAKQKVVGAISDIIRDVTGIKNEDVFPPWNKIFLPWIKEKFKTAQEWLHSTLAPVLKHVGIELPAPKTEPQIAGDEFAEEIPDAMPYGEVYRDVFAEAPDLSGGTPLPPRVRAQAESRFGHDFGHVRLHTGAQAEAVNRPIGAQALTTGSHILINGAAPDSLDDNHVLRHELTHVVQQTGPRPLGTPSDPTPRTGSPGGGVRVDPSAESTANRVAGQTAHAGVASAPVAAGGGNAAVGGLQPSLLEEIGHRFLRYLVNYEEIEEDVEAVDKRAKRRGRIGREVRDAIAQLPKELARSFGSLHVHASVKGTFGQKLKAIGDHLSNQKDDIQHVVRRLAIESSDPKPGPKGGTAKRPKMQLNARKLEAKLGRYIFGKTGILLEIDLKQQGGKGFKGPHEKLVTADPVDKLTVRFVHLPPISSNSTLWKDVLLTRPGDPLNPTQSTKLTDDERNELRPRIRQVLRHMGPASNVWDRKSYQLDVAVFREVETLRKLEVELGTKGFLPPDVLPPNSDYVKPEEKPVNDVVGQIGLRLGTYDDRRNHGSQWGKERESHHITQYILAAYFHNGKGTKPETTESHRAFKLDLKQGPAVYTSSLNTSGQLVNKFAGTKGTVEIAETEKGRGGIMPAILLSRPTHRYGDLHITPDADDFGDPEQTTQAGALNSTFVGALPDKYVAAEKRGQTDYAEWLKYKKEVGEEAVAGHIYDAMQHTYKTLRDYMQARLEPALKGKEREYYNDIATNAPKPPVKGSEVSQTQMGHVYKAAVERNNTELKKKGWVG